MFEHPQKMIEGFKGRQVVILGDLVADQFLHGTINRVSREAPVFILRHDETETVPGGAANAALNVAALGGHPVLAGVVGDDENGRLLIERLESAGVNCENVITAAGRRTTTKVRVLAGQDYAPKQQVIRIDYENDGPVSDGARHELERRVTGAADSAEAIVISDYNYGAACPSMMAAIRLAAGNRGIPLVVDSRFRLGEFPNATTATPNQEEVEQILGKGFGIEDCVRLCGELRYEALLVTRGNKGMYLIERGGRAIKIDPVGAVEPVDVTGAGDTVIAVYSLGLASGLGFETAARVANCAGGIVVMKKGTAAVDTQELAEVLRIEFGGRE